MTDHELRILNAKNMVLAVLSGRLTPESNPAAFEEDSVYISVRITEQHDPEWLLRSLSQAGAPGKTKQRVIECMGPLRAHAEALIGPDESSQNS